MATSDANLYRQAWRKFPTGVSIVTTRSADGKPYATTANALLSVALDPPLLLLSVGTGGQTCANLAREGRFGVSFLPDDQAEVADFYARAAADERGTLPPSHTAPGGDVALLDGALAAMACRIEQSVEAGDHTLFVASVEHVEVGEGNALLFYDGRYGSARQDMPA